MGTQCLSHPNPEQGGGHCDGGTVVWSTPRAYLGSAPCQESSLESPSWPGTETKESRMGMTHPPVPHTAYTVYIILHPWEIAATSALSNFP